MSSPVGGGGFFGGLDIETIVGALIDAQRGPIQRAQENIKSLKSRLSAYGEISSSIGKLDSVRASSLNAASLQAQVARSSDETRLVATAGGSAAVGQHALTIAQLAQSDRQRTQSYLDRNLTPIVQGVLEFTVDGETTSVTVDDTNDTLQGVANAINADANGGARASIINDGSGDVLVLASKATGLSSDIVFGTNTTDLAFTQTQAAQDAEFSLDGIDITSSSNKVTTALAGVTLDLRQADPDTALSFEVTTDAQQVEDSVRSFVDAFNSTLAVIERHSAADRSGQGQGGVLAGDSTLRSIKAGLIASVSGRVTPSDGLSHDLLSAVGVTYGRTGRLELDSAKLREQVDEDPARVANLFLTRGTASSGAFRLAASSTASQAGTYAVEVTSVAEQATLLGDNVLDPGGLAQDESLTVTVGGSVATANLLAGNTETEVLQLINDALGDAGIRGVAESVGGRIRVTTNAYGSAHQVSVASSVGSIAGSVGFDVTDRTDAGVDIVGTLGGLAATGTGQVLTGAAGGSTAGLLVAVTGSGTGNLGDLTFRVGLSERLDRAIDAATKSGTGRLPPLTSTLQGQVRSQETRIERMERQLTDRADTMRQRFTAAQSALSALQAMQGSLNSLT